jgi:hypothetical protein
MQVWKDHEGPDTYGQIEIGDGNWFQARDGEGWTDVGIAAGRQMTIEGDLKIEVCDFGPADPHIVMRAAKVVFDRESEDLTIHFRGPRKPLTLTKYDTPDGGPLFISDWAARPGAMQDRHRPAHAGDPGADRAVSLTDELALRAALERCGRDPGGASRARRLPRRGRPPARRERRQLDALEALGAAAEHGEMGLDLGVAGASFRRSAHRPWIASVTREQVGPTCRVASTTGRVVDHARPGHRPDRGHGERRSDPHASRQPGLGEPRRALTEQDTP